MDHQIWRLLWAFPLVIGLGVVTLLWLRRMGVGVSTVQDQQASSAAPTQVLSRTELSPHTTLLIVAVDGKRFLLTESTAQVSVHGLGDVLPQAAAPISLMSFLSTPNRRQAWSRSA